MSAAQPWTTEELRLLASMYACMLRHEQANETYNKRAHNRWLQARVERSQASIEFKLANLSSALFEAGLPFIPGYKPRRNRQGELDHIVKAGIGALTPPACPVE